MRSAAVTHGPGIQITSILGLERPSTPPARRRLRRRPAPPPKSPRPGRPRLSLPPPPPPFPRVLNSKPVGLVARPAGGLANPDRDPGPVKTRTATGVGTPEPQWPRFKFPQCRKPELAPKQMRNRGRAREPGSPRPSWWPPRRLNSDHSECIIPVGTHCKPRGTDGPSSEHFGRLVWCLSIRPPAEADCKSPE